MQLKHFIEIDERWCCPICEIFIEKQKRQIDKKIPRQDRYFSLRLPDAIKKIREIYFDKVYTKYDTTQDMINNLQSLKCEKKLKFHQSIGNDYDETGYRRRSNTFEFPEDLFKKMLKVLINFIMT